MLKNNMTMMGQVKHYIDAIEYGKSILLGDVVREFFDENVELKKTRNTISAYLNRLVRNGELKKFDDGIFYKIRLN